MKLLVKLSPKRFFKSKNRSSVSRSNPPSFGSDLCSSSSDDALSLSNQKPDPCVVPVSTGTPTSVLPGRSADWNDISPDVISVNIYDDFVQAFRFLDTDDDGVVSRKELESLLYRLGSDPPTGDEVRFMLNEVDVEGNGCISLDALRSRMAGSVTEPACDSELRDTFDFFDADHDGKITAEELLAVFTAIGDERCTLDDCMLMIASVDKNKDGFVCIEDFSRMMELRG